MKLLFYACSLTICTLISEQVIAQKAVNSPLTVGVDVGFLLSENASDSIPFLISTQQVQLRGSYRIKRWLGINASISYLNISEVDDSFIRNPLSIRDGEPWGWAKNTHRIPMVIGPEFNIRVGQGDISLAAQLGLIYHQSKAHVHDTTNTYVLKYAPTINFYNSLSLSYSYWPQKRFGVKIGVQIQDWLSGDYSDTELSSSSQLENAELDNNIINWASPRTSPYSLNLFQIGLTYRL